MRFTLWIVFLFSVSAFGFGQSEPSKGDVWLYAHVRGDVAISYNGTPIRFNPEVGDGAFDRPINLGPPHRYVFIDAGLTLDDAAGVVAFWKSLDPKTPTNFVVISSKGEYYEFPARFEQEVVPANVLDSVRSELRKVQR